MLGYVLDLLLPKGRIPYVLVKTTICAFKSLVVLFTLRLSLTDHICLEGGSVELQEDFGIRSQLKLWIKVPVWLVGAMKA